MFKVGDRVLVSTSPYWEKEDQESLGYKTGVIVGFEFGSFYRIKIGIRSVAVYKDYVRMNGIERALKCLNPNSK